MLTSLPDAGGLGEGHKGLYDTLNNSLHFQLALGPGLSGCGDFPGGAAHVLAASLCLHG
jgi:hypothetical protein